MDSWTHPIGVIIMDTFSKSNKESLRIAKSVVDRLPRLTGDEGDAHIYINLCVGHNTVEMGKRQWQTMVLLTVFGHLRNRSVVSTRVEVDRLIHVLESLTDVYVSFAHIDVKD